MDENSAENMISDEIQKMIAAFLPNGAGTMTEIRLKTALEKVGQVAFTTGKLYALTNLKTSEDLAVEFGVSLRRVQALAQERHQRFGVGMQIKGKNPWLFSADEIENMRPGKTGRPKAEHEDTL